MSAKRSSQIKPRHVIEPTTDNHQIEMLERSRIGIKNMAVRLTPARGVSALDTKAGELHTQRSPDDLLTRQQHAQAREWRVR